MLVGLLDVVQYERKRKRLESVKKVGGTSALNVVSSLKSIVTLSNMCGDVTSQGMTWFTVHSSWRIYTMRDINVNLVTFFLVGLIPPTVVAYKQSKLIIWKFVQPLIFKFVVTFSKNDFLFPENIIRSVLQHFTQSFFLSPSSPAPPISHNHVPVYRCFW